MGQIDYEVDQAGIISLPLAGRIPVAKLTTQAAERVIAKRLSQGVGSTPNVTVSVGSSIITRNLSLDRYEGLVVTLQGRTNPDATPAPLSGATVQATRSGTTHVLTEVAGTPGSHTGEFLAELVTPAPAKKRRNGGGRKRAKAAAAA